MGSILSIEDLTLEVLAAKQIDICTQIKVHASHRTNWMELTKLTT